MHDRATRRRIYSQYQSVAPIELADAHQGEDPGRKEQEAADKERRKLKIDALKSKNERAGRWCQTDWPFSKPSMLSAGVGGLVRPSPSNHCLAAVMLWNLRVSTGGAGRIHATGISSVIFARNVLLSSGPLGSNRGISISLGYSRVLGPSTTSLRGKPPPQPTRVGLTSEIVDRTILVLRFLPRSGCRSIFAVARAPPITTLHPWRVGRSITNSNALSKSHVRFCAFCSCRCSAGLFWPSACGIPSARIVASADIVRRNEFGRDPRAQLVLANPTRSKEDRPELDGGNNATSFQAAFVSAKTYRFNFCSCCRWNAAGLVVGHRGFASLRRNGVGDSEKRHGRRQAGPNHRDRSFGQLRHQQPRQGGDMARRSFV